VANPKVAESTNPDQRKTAQAQERNAIGKSLKSSSIQYIIGRTGQVSQK
jgi:hypothetical protein